MDFPSQAVIAVLTYLLPGLITAALVYTLTPSPRPIPFERLVQALIFTMLVQVGVSGVKFAALWLGLHVVPLGTWTDQVRLAWSVVLAGGLGLLLAWAANTDRVHAVLRALGITSQTSFSSEWYGAFSRNKGYVVLHLNGQRRLYGWPVEWPSTPGEGHFVMAKAEWLNDGSRIELAGVARILVRAEDVEMVELMEIVTEATEITNGRPKGTDTTATTTEQGIDEHRQGNSVSTSAAIQARATTTAAAEKVAVQRTRDVPG